MNFNGNFKVIYYYYLFITGTVSFIVEKASSSSTKDLTKISLQSNLNNKAPIKAIGNTELSGI